MNKKTLRDIDVRNKKVLVRVDFNVPMEKDGTITDDSRIRAALPTLNYLLDHGAAVIVASHLGRPKGKVVPELSLGPVARHLESLLGKRVTMAGSAWGPEVSAAAAALRPGEVLMLENVRFHPGEEKNDKGFAKELASFADIFVNDAFGAAHRAHSSTAGVAEFIPAVAGFLMETEVTVLGSLLNKPERPFVAIIGGAKVSDKISVLQNLVGRVDALLIGGGMAHTFRAAGGVKMGDSLIEPDRFSDARKILQAAEARGIKVFLPVDVVVADAFSETANTKVVEGDVPDGWQALDIGPKTRDQFAQMIKSARTVFWNGPLGVFEMAPFSAGTHAIARAVAECEGMTVAGGGETLAAIEQAGVASRIKHLSTGGGASLEFLEGRELPGVAVLLDRTGGAR